MLWENTEKRELICKDPTSRGIVLPGVNIINSENDNLLSSHIGGLQWVDACVREKMELLQLMGDR